MEILECRLNQLQSEIDSLKLLLKTPTCLYAQPFHICAPAGCEPDIVDPSFKFYFHDGVTLQSKKCHEIESIFETHTDNHKNSCCSVQKVRKNEYMDRYVVALKSTAWVKHQFDLEKELRDIGYEIYQTAIYGSNGNEYLNFLVDSTSVKDRY